MEPTNKTTVNQPQAAIQMSMSLFPLSVTTRQHPRQALRTLCLRITIKSTITPSVSAAAVLARYTICLLGSDTSLISHRTASWPPSSASSALVRTFGSGLAEIMTDWASNTECCKVHEADCLPLIAYPDSFTGVLRVCRGHHLYVLPAVMWRLTDHAKHLGCPCEMCC